MAQGVDPVFKPQYPQKKKKKEKMQAMDFLGEKCFYKIVDTLGLAEWLKR
jgi:hypothetical protein